MRDDSTPDTKQNDVPEQPAQKDDGQGTDKSADRAQPELTEQNLLSELTGAYAKDPDPAQREHFEGELEEMQEDIEDANSE